MNLALRPAGHHGKSVSHHRICRMAYGIRGPCYVASPWIEEAASRTWARMKLEVQHQNRLGFNQLYSLSQEYPSPELTELLCGELA